MFRLFIFQCCILFASISYAQNMVPNSSFEELNSVPCSFTNKPIDFHYIYSDWSLPTGGTSDVFTTAAAQTCFSHPLSTAKNAIGFQMPFSGNAMVAILTYGSGCINNLPNYREYVQVELTDALIPGRKYYASMHVSRADSAMWATNNLAMLFTNQKNLDPLNCFTINETPQIAFKQIITEDKQWVLLADTFTATSNYKFLTIGNFKTDIQTDTTVMPLGKLRKAQYFLDAVAVFEVCHASTNEIDLCDGETVALTATIDKADYTWSTGQTTQSIEITDTGTFWVEMVFAGCTTIDTFKVQPTACFLLKMPNVFTPNNDGVNDFFSPIALLGIATFELHIYNRFGSAVYQTTDPNFLWDGTHNNKPLAAGVYFWQARATNKNGKTREANGNLTLMR